MTNGRQVAIVGAGKTPFGAFPGKDLQTLAVEAGRKALGNAKTGPEAIEAFYVGNFAGPEFTGAACVSRATETVRRYPASGFLGGIRNNPNV